jgi:hypothetical protein
MCLIPFIPHLVLLPLELASAQLTDTIQLMSAVFLHSLGPQLYGRDKDPVLYVEQKKKGSADLCNTRELSVGTAVRLDDLSKVKVWTTLHAVARRVSGSITAEVLGNSYQV